MIETLHNGDPVGWSWLFEPYLSHFDARSRGTTRAIKFDAAALRLALQRTLSSATSLCAASRR